MTKNPKIVKEENLIIRLEDGTRITPQNYFVEPHTSSLKNYGLVYQKGSKVPFTGIAEYFRGNTIIAVKTFFQGLLYGELDLSQIEPVWGTYIETLWQKTQEEIEDIYVYHNDKESKFLSIRGEVEGSFKSYYANGQLESKENYFNRKPHGLFEYFDEEGTLLESKTWKNGLLVQ